MACPARVQVVQACSLTLRGDEPTLGLPWRACLLRLRLLGVVSKRPRRPRPEVCELDGAVCLRGAQGGPCQGRKAQEESEQERGRRELVPFRS